jgi:hypothetical protein
LASSLLRAGPLERIVRCAGVTELAELVATVTARCRIEHGKVVLGATVAERTTINARHDCACAQGSDNKTKLEEAREQTAAVANSRDD